MIKSQDNQLKTSILPFLNTKLGYFKTEDQFFKFVKIEK